MSRLVKLELAATLLVALLAGCALVPHHPRPQSLAAWCSTAEKVGWCEPECGKRQPAECGPIKILKCSDLMCMGELSDGSIVFVAKITTMLPASRPE